MSVENILREIGDPSNSQLLENPADAEKSASSARKSPHSAAAPSAVGDKRKVGNIRYNSSVRTSELCYLIYSGQDSRGI